MAFWSEWSDGTRWFMGIIAAIVTTVLIRLLLPALPPFPGGQGTPPHTEQNPLTRPANPVVEHVGDKDPLTEGFTSGVGDASAEQKAHWGDIRLSASQSPPSWRILNPVHGAVPYLYVPSKKELNEARDNGWRITLKVRVIQLTNPDGGIFADFDSGVRRYDLNIIPAYPHDPKNNIAEKLILRLNTHVEAPHRATGLQSGNEWLIDGKAPHLYVMTYDPNTVTATVYVDDKELMREKYQGHTDFLMKGAFEFGASGAEATFELVRFEVFR